MSSRFDRDQVITILTAIFVVLEVVSIVVRIFMPWPEAAVLDSVLPLIVGYWFFRKNGNGAKKEEVPA